MKFSESFQVNKTKYAPEQNVTFFRGWGVEAVSNFPARDERISIAPAISLVPAAER